MLILSNQDIEKILSVGACQTVSQVRVGGRIDLHSHRASGYQSRFNQRLADRFFRGKASRKRHS
jgi:hypothetical protein